VPTAKPPSASVSPAHEQRLVTPVRTGTVALMDRPAISTDAAVHDEATDACEGRPCGSTHQCPPRSNNATVPERGVEVDHVAIYRWVQRFTPLLIDAARPCRHGVGDPDFCGAVLASGACRDTAIVPGFPLAGSTSKLGRSK
jgi:hypothetical protein